MKHFIPDKLEHEIIPGILEQEWSEIEKKLEIVKPFAKTVHIDLLDGKFVNNKTWIDPAPFKKYTSELFFEVHFMVESPLRYLKPFADAGFKRFIGHIEKMPDVAEFVAEGQLLGEVGLAIDKQTAAEKITVSYEDLDVLLVMTIQAGFSGQTFRPELLEKVRQIRSKSEFIPIEIDGGVRKENVLQAKAAGVNRFVATTAIFASQNPHEEYSSLVGMLRGS